LKLSVKFRVNYLFELIQRLRTRHHNTVNKERGRTGHAERLAISKVLLDIGGVLATIKTLVELSRVQIRLLCISLQVFNVECGLVLPKKFIVIPVFVLIAGTKRRFMAFFANW
jgi:hypothetical protein